MFESPQGPLPPEIYRRRRVAALIVALVVVLVIAGIVYAVAANRPDESPGAAPATSTSASNASSTGSSSAGSSSTEATDGETSATTTKKSSGRCDDKALQVIAEVAPVVAAGSSPDLVMRVRNISDKACDVEVGAAAQKYSVYRMQNFAQVWSNEHCEMPKERRTETLQPGGESTFVIKWRETKPNAAGQCEPAGAAASPAGPYLLYTVLGERNSEPADFRIE